MCEGKEPDIHQSRRFEKAVSKLSEDLQDIIDEQVDLIIENPEIGEKKKGDLSFLYVHKFKVGVTLYLLGYTYTEDDGLVLYLLQFGPHENFYKEARRKRKGDLKVVK